MSKDKIKVNIEKKFCWKKWMIKLGKNIGIILIAGIASVYGDNPLFLALAPIVSAVENYIKHK